MDKRGLAIVATHRGDAADHDRVGVAVQHFFDFAVDAGERVTQKRSAGDERHPVGPFEARGALDAAASRETIGETLMPAAENIDAKRLARAKRSESRGREGDANDQGRRFERQRA